MLSTIIIKKWGAIALHPYTTPRIDPSGVAVVRVDVDGMQHQTQSAAGAVGATGGERGGDSLHRFAAGGACDAHA